MLAQHQAERANAKRSEHLELDVCTGVQPLDRAAHRILPDVLPKSVCGWDGILLCSVHCIVHLLFNSLQHMPGTWRLLAEHGWTIGQVASGPHIPQTGSSRRHVWGAHAGPAQEHTAHKHLHPRSQLQASRSPASASLTFSIFLSSSFSTPASSMSSFLTCSMGSLCDRALDTSSLVL